MQLESLIIPEIDAAKEAGELIYNLPGLRNKACIIERRKVYVDVKKTNSIIAIRPKPPFGPIFQVSDQRKVGNSYLKRALQRLVRVSGGDGGDLDFLKAMTRVELLYKTLEHMIAM